MTDPKLEIAYWNITNECNQRCKYCWLSAGSKKGDELQTEQWLYIFKKIIDLGLVGIKITGGEPLFHWKKIKQVLEFLMDHGIDVTMETNATMICGEHSSDILRTLQNEHVRLLSVSLDSCRPSDHDTFRGMEGAFEKTTKAISLLKENQITFSIVTVLHNKNYKQIKDIIHFAREINPLYHQINTVMLEGRAKIHDEYQLAAEFYIHTLPSLIKEIKTKMGSAVQFNVPYIFNPLGRDSPNCSVGTKICGFLPNGDIAVCGAGNNKKELVLGNALVDDIEDIWLNSGAFLTLRKDVFESKGVCGNCLFARYCRGYCRAYSFSVYGQLDAPFPICQMLYEEGIFPEKYMIDPKKDCSFST